MNKLIIPDKIKMSDIDIIIRILAMLGDKYEVAVSSLEDRMPSMTKPLEMGEVQEKIIMRHDWIERMRKRK